MLPLIETCAMAIKYYDILLNASNAIISLNAPTNRQAKVGHRQTPYRLLTNKQPGLVPGCLFAGLH